MNDSFGSIIKDSRCGKFLMSSKHVSTLLRVSIFEAIGHSLLFTVLPERSLRRLLFYRYYCCASDVCIVSLCRWCSGSIFNSVEWKNDALIVCLRLWIWVNVKENQKKTIINAILGLDYLGTFKLLWNVLFSWQFS